MCVAGDLDRGPAQRIKRSDQPADQHGLAYVFRASANNDDGHRIVRSLSVIVDG